MGMHGRQYLAVLVLSALVLGCATGIAPVPKPQVATGTVTQEAAVFWFPVEDADRTWRWGHTIVGALEYAWWVRVSLLGKEYELGYSHFKAPNSNEEQGNLQELLLSGQVNVWDNGRYVKGTGGVSAKRVGSGVAIRLTEPEFLAAFRDERPEQVLMRTHGYMLNKKDETVQVTYAQEPGVF